MKKLLLVLILSLGLIGISSAEEVDTNILKLKSLNACKGCSFIGIDFGGTKISTGIVNIAGKIVGEIVTFPTKSWESPEEIFETLTRVANVCLKRSKMSLKNISGIGIGVHTVVDNSTDTLVSVDTLPVMEGFNLKDKLSEQTSLNSKLKSEYDDKVRGLEKEIKTNEKLIVQLEKNQQK